MKLICLWVFVCLFWAGSRAESCLSCNPEECLPVTDCVAGIIKDQCGCCDVCAKSEFELCDHTRLPSLNMYGKCGEDLECTIRTDLNEGESQEAICYCKSQESVCGTDNFTYDNICQLRASAVVTKSGVTLAREGPCNTAPVIIVNPENVKNVSGSSISLSCEAKGFPIPVIEWTWTRVDKQTVTLPSDDLHVSINMRGGPEKYHVSGWLQIIGLKKEHEGDYSCIAQNDFGFVKSSARVNVVRSGDRFKGEF
ncbi:hypothetical protein HELRODRAFT_185515 [Helobdella robusta]|uniref:Uncharacterized protein n=1 Tax=Helobdella robusta TaxID=6412 RepID=T1FMX2_HELRO|nr:hypothetical protein HELRODRAFT_185515 [Helobdella robusta]ESO05329.1 hypothetical protein HELRODRAFT_185515 [Helobdella robusta]